MIGFYFMVKVVGSETLDDDDRGSQISRFLEGYREGRTLKKKIGGPSFIGFINSLIDIRTVYLIVFIVAVLMAVRSFSQSEDTPPTQQDHAVEGTEASISETESSRSYQPGDKEDWNGGHFNSLLQHSLLPNVRLALVLPET